MDKQYLVTEKELNQLVFGYYQFSGQPVRKWVKDYLEDEQPVELLAEGIFNFDNKNVPFWVDNIQVSMKEYKGKPIKIMVGVSK